MKKIIYSNYTKLTAVILCIASIALTVLTATNGIARFLNEKDYIYGFENSFSESKYFSSVLTSAEACVHHTYYMFYKSDDGEVRQRVVVDGKSFDQYLEQQLLQMYYYDKINYYVAINDKVFTNSAVSSAEELTNSEFFRYTMRNKNGNITNHTSLSYDYYNSYIDDILPINKSDVITVCTSVKEEYAAECEAAWQRQAGFVREAFLTAFAYAALALFLLIYLICVSGKTVNGEIKLMWIDSIWTEIHLVIMGISGIAAVGFCLIIVDEYQSARCPLYLMQTGVVSVSALASMLIITSLLSLIRNIKCGKFIKASIICRIVIWLGKIFVRVTRWIFVKIKAFKSVIAKALSRKTGVILMTTLFIYTALTAVLTVAVIIAPFWIVPAVLLFPFAAFVLAYRAKDIDEVRKGAGEIRNGNLHYKIPELKSEDMKELASNINDIAEGLESSVAERLKAERLKTELITNVSHDLKTPLTSIISYTELLSKVEGLPEEAKDYIEIIAKKSDRLKNLTQDLFDISKVQSGNENVIFEKLNVAVLINQALGENDSEIKNSELKFCVDVEKELYINADGRKMSRVISNLISNILKYTMKNTRVFISAIEKDDEVIIEFKNVASYALEFNAEEITGRFVRGDKSRSIEGNGLGLAIAKSYTEACGGRFSVVTDGDLFKVLIRFDKYNLSQK